MREVDHVVDRHADEDGEADAKKEQQERKAAAVGAPPPAMKVVSPAKEVDEFEMSVDEDIEEVSLDEEDTGW